MSPFPSLDPSPPSGENVPLMTARQGKVLVIATVLVMTVLLVRQAFGPTGDWVGLVVTETQILVAMAISWWILRSEVNP